MKMLNFITYKYGNKKMETIKLQQIVEEQKWIISEQTEIINNLRNVIESSNNHTYKKCEIYRITAIPSDNRALPKVYIGKTNQKPMKRGKVDLSKKRFWQHVYDKVNSFVKGINTGKISDNWNSFKLHIPEEKHILKSLFFQNGMYKFPTDETNNILPPSKVFADHFVIPKHKKGKTIMS